MMGRIAAIDFGLKRIGIALSDLTKKIAMPFRKVEGGKNAILQIRDALQGKEVEKIIIGLPLLLNGKKGEMAEIVERFGKSLEEALKIPVLFFDERLTSKQAEVSLREISLNRKERNEKIDLVAATLLLQTYLDQQR